MQAAEGLAIVVFEDDGYDRRKGRSAESKAAEYLLERRGGGGLRSPSDGSRFMGPPPAGGHGGVAPADRGEVAANTCRLVDDALGDLPAAWRSCVLVGAAWRLGVRGLRDSSPRDGGAPFLARAGFSTDLPQGFGRRGLDSFVRTFREALIARGVVRHRGVDDLPASPRAAAFVQVPDVDLLEGIDGIAFAFRCSARTVKRWIADELVPIHRTPGGRVWARRSELEAAFHGADPPDFVR
jgi:hypothetical protein